MQQFVVTFKLNANTIATVSEAEILEWAKDKIEDNRSDDFTEPFCEIGECEVLQVREVK